MNAPDNHTLDNHKLEHSSPIIGYHRAPLSQKFGAPRQPNLVTLNSMIEMLAPFDNPAAFTGLEDFSHIWLSWQFHHNHLNKERINNNSIDKSSTFRAQVRPPRLGGNQKIGVFASRSMYRPSNLGLSVVKLERIDVVEGRALLVISGADMIDGTPIIDIKPYVAYSDAHSDAASGFAANAPKLQTVTMTDTAAEQFRQIVYNKALTNKTFDDKKDAISTAIYQVQRQLLSADLDYIKALIAQDPRPAYRRDELNSPFVMRYKSVDVSFVQTALGELQINSIIEV